MRGPKGEIREVRIYGDPVLRRKARKVEVIDPETLQFVADLMATMLAKDGLGLAANQIGELWAIVAINPRGIKVDRPPLVLINPEVVECSGEIEREEACLSLPGISEVLARPAKVRVKGLDCKGEALDVNAEGTLARALLHEIDHLNGVLFIDHLAPARRKLLKTKLQELEKTSRESLVTKSVESV